MKKESTKGEGVQTFPVSMPAYFYKALERRAIVEKKTTDELILEALKFYYFMDKSLLFNAEQTAPRFLAQPAEYIGNIAIQMIALNSAVKELFGEEMDLFHKLFVYEKKDGSDYKALITGSDLFYKLKQDFIEKLEKDRDQIINEKVI